jgi:hypothetical protein
MLPNFEILCQAVHLDKSEDLIQQAANLIQKTPIDWNDLINRAYCHRIIPSLYKLLSKLPEGLVPQEVLAELKSITQDNLFVQLRNLGEFLRINQILKTEGIRAIPFKGFWLAQAFYGSLGDRESVDIDLMIDVKHLEKVRELLFKQDYVVEAPLGELTDDYIKGQLCEYNLDYYQGEERVYHFEFHWRIDHAEKGMDMGMEDLKEQIIKTTIQGHKVEVFSPSANFLLALMHHGGKDQLTQLKQVQDLSLMLQHANEMDWEWIIQKAQKYQVEPLIWIGIKLAQELTGIPIPENLSKKTASRFVKKMVQSRLKLMQDEPELWYGSKQEWARNLFHFRTRDNWEVRKFLLKNYGKVLVGNYLIPRQFHRLFFNTSIRKTIKEQA